MKLRDYSPADQFVIGLDQVMRTLFGHPLTTERPNPAKLVPETELSVTDRDLAARLLRVNHSGEVCAQALYQGQALTARLPEVRKRLEQTALEESDHLDWCATRLQELETHTSLLNPVWYAGSFAIGALAGFAGDKWSLGLVAETERQVEAQMAGHLNQLPTQDLKSRVILEQMRQDESAHANQALAAGGAALPQPLKLAMGVAAHVMTSTSYWL